MAHFHPLLYSTSTAVSNFGSKYPGKEIWITEFGRDINNVGQPGGAQMLTDVINKLESTPQVSRYGELRIDLVSYWKKVENSKE